MTMGPTALFVIHPDGTVDAVLTDEMAADVRAKTIGGLVAAAPIISDFRAPQTEPSESAASPASTKDSAYRLTVPGGNVGFNIHGGTWREAKEEMMNHLRVVHWTTRSSRPRVNDQAWRAIADLYAQTEPCPSWSSYIAGRLYCIRRD